MAVTTHNTIMYGQCGRLEVSIDVPEKCTRGIAFLAHPLTTAGGTKDHKVITTMSKSLTRAGFIVVRPNLRSAGMSEGEFDAGIGETDDFLRVIEQTFEIHGITEELPLGGQVIFGGFSFGTYVSSLAAQVRKPAALILAGTAIGKFDVPVPEVPAFIVHAQNDELITADEVLAWAAGFDESVTIVPNADHVFNRKLSPLGRVFDRFVALAAA